MLLESDNYSAKEVGVVARRGATGRGGRIGCAVIGCAEVDCAEVGCAGVGRG